ncbi:hypothetical protein ZIOFF_060255 [Zingiber officinale]|uniref:Uncharacterized protein n=1 Tax=Zingiber officinale TaxID=94328 RepID=A0A8J5FAJ4_ZINOF|nr:hypothetical protein ZIOFF_060255 [Zingiber officinale]
MNMLDKQMAQLLKDYDIAKAKAIASSFIPDDASSTYSDLDDQTNAHDTGGKGLADAESSGGGIGPTQYEAQPEGLTASFEPYPLYAEYQELADAGKIGIFLPEEHDKRKRTTDIERYVCHQIITSVREIEFIFQLKEYDLQRRAHHERRQSYCQKYLPTVKDTRMELWKVLSTVKEITKDVENVPP